jgi:hypothetical protein
MKQCGHHEMKAVGFSPTPYMARCWKHRELATATFVMSVFPVSCSNFDSKLYCRLTPAIGRGTAQPSIIV